MSDLIDHYAHERVDMTPEDIAYQLAFEYAVLEYVLGEVAIPHDVVVPVSMNPDLTDHVLRRVNEQIPRPIHPSVLPEIQDRAGQINEWFIRIWESVDRTKAQKQAVQAVDNSLPSMEVGRYGFANPDMRSSVARNLGSRGISIF
jgi:hypothetical protein